ncbi:MAG: hypothetical protein ACXW3M_14175 [Rhodoplanes sp.]
MKMSMSCSALRKRNACSAAGRIEGDDAAAVAHLPHRQRVLRMVRQRRVQHPLQMAVFT